MAGDQNGASSGWVALNNLVSRDDTFLIVGSTKLIGKSIFADTTKVGS